MDAGPDERAERSQWVRVETDPEQSIRSVNAFDTPLAEHLPADLIDAIWPSDSTAMVRKDGKLSQERSVFEARAAAEGRLVIEAKKSPNSILWHESPRGPLPANFGDAVIDDHGEILLQTVPQNPTDYIRPVRHATNGGDAVGVATAFLHQHAIPGLSFLVCPVYPGHSALRIWSAS